MSSNFKPIKALRDLLFELQQIEVPDGRQFKEACDAAWHSRKIAAGRRRADYIRSQLDKYDGGGGSTTAGEYAAEELIFLQDALEFMDESSSVSPAQALRELLDVMKANELPAEEMFDLEWARINAEKVLREISKSASEWGTENVKRIFQEAGRMKR